MSLDFIHATTGDGILRAQNLYAPQSQAAADYELATGRPSPQPPGKPMGVVEASPNGKMVVTISHEFFTDSLVVQWAGQSEELTHIECLAWFKRHGAKNEDKLNEAVNCALNFGKSVFTISDPIKQSYQTDPIDPKL